MNTWSAIKAVANGIRLRFLTGLAIFYLRNGKKERSDTIWQRVVVSANNGGVELPGRTLAMQKLAIGVRRFRKCVFRKRRRLFERLARGQHPEILFIACSDSRKDPNLITQSEPGELFVVRTIGNIVPAYDTGDVGLQSAIEYALKVLHVKAIVLCGHSHCGAMSALIRPEKLGGLDATAAFLQHAASPATAVITGGNEDELVLSASKANVEKQIEHLMSYPLVAIALAEGNLEVHGWVYQIDTGEVVRLDQSGNCWMRL